MTGVSQFQKTVYEKPTHAYLDSHRRRGTISFSFASTCAKPGSTKKLAEIKTAMAANKQALAHYTWQEQQTTSIKGDEKQVFQVSVGPDGHSKTRSAARKPRHPVAARSAACGGEEDG